MIYFTADQHFGHANIIKYCKRPFSNVDEMDQALIDNWNSVVTPKDMVYSLGDFTLKEFRAFENYVRRLNGSIVFIPGGHDKWVKDFEENYTLSKTNNIVYLREALVTAVFYGRVFVLSHYSLRSWDRQHHGAFHLFGHSHGMLGNYGKSMDVGVDCWNYTPVSLDTVVGTLETKPTIKYHEKDWNEIKGLYWTF